MSNSELPSCVEYVLAQFGRHLPARDHRAALLRIRDLRTNSDARVITDVQALVALAAIHPAGGIGSLDALDALITVATSDAIDPAPDLTGASFAGLDIVNAYPNDLVAPGSDWTGCLFAGCGFNAADLTGAKLVDTRVQTNTISGSSSGFDLLGANLSGADCQRAFRRVGEGTGLGDSLRWVGVNFTGARLDGADLGSHEGAPPAGQIGGYKVQSSGMANLTGASCRGTSFVDVAFSDFNGGGAILTNADLTGADLRGARLTYVTGLASASLRDARADWLTTWPANYDPTDPAHAIRTEVGPRGRF